MNSSQLVCLGFTIDTMSCLRWTKTIATASYAYQFADALGKAGCHWSILDAGAAIETR